MDYEKLFEDLKNEALAKGKEEEKLMHDLLQQGLFLALGKDPAVRHYPIEKLKEGIRNMENFVALCKKHPQRVPKEVTEVLETTVETLKGCAMAIWYKEYTLSKMVDAVIEDPLEVQKELKAYEEERKKAEKKK